METTTKTNDYLFQVAQEVRRGKVFSLADDLSLMINSSTNAMLIFRRIVVSLVREYRFDEKRGFPEDSDGSGWQALCQFWELCRVWDLPDREFFAKGDSIAGNYTDVIDSIDQFLVKFPSSASHLYWGAMKTAFYSRTVKAHG